ncbi:MAG: cytochrome c-type biogenesis protein CcmH [Methylobacteriaceae bacterium]|nr:cytochrome c-type biogenesis protein CcmH [Methylobacteriaceae bacterium]
MIRALILGAALLLAALAPAYAVRPDEMLPDPQLEARAREISSELRCMVCQNQSIDDSDAPLARDLRLLVRERLNAGDSDSAIRTFLTARYGDFILLKPPFKFQTALLWTGPVLIFLIGALIIFLRRTRSDSASPSSAELSAEERAALAAVLASEETARPGGS